MSFKLPKWGGAMVHSDPQQSDNINLQVPRNNVDILWIKDDLDSEKAGTQGNGIASNGVIAANTYNGKKDNLIIYDYYGKRLWTSGYKLNLIATTSTPMIDTKNRVVVSDNKKIIMVGPVDNGFDVIWQQYIDYEGPGLRNTGIIIPFSPTIVDEKIIILPTKGGPTYAFDVEDGSKLGEIYLGLGEITHDSGFFSTINSPCVNGKRVYITTEMSIPSSRLRKIYLGRLYAIDVKTDASNPDEIFSVAWYYPFIGRSQASPLFIKDTVYFDIFTSLIGVLEKPFVCALADHDDSYEEKWRIRYPPDYQGIWDSRDSTWYSFSKDPRGGFWYEDLRGKRLVRFNESDGSIIQEIPVKKLVPMGELGIFFPLSCMTIYDKKDPVMIISVISFFNNKYTMAIDLNKINGDEFHDSILWRVKVKSRFGFNAAGGQFTILKRDDDFNNNRIFCSTYWSGVMAIGAVD
jgi:hypothetical protein